MSKKWLVVWLIGILIITSVIGYLFFAVKKEKQTIQNTKQAEESFKEFEERLSAQPFDYTKDMITGTILAKTSDEGGNRAFKLYVSWPSNSPIYDKNVIVATNCSPETSSLAFFYPPYIDEEIKEEAVDRGIDAYGQAEENDLIRAFCLNQYCSEIGGAC